MQDAIDEIDEVVDDAVSKTREINGYDLSEDRTLFVQDIPSRNIAHIGTGNIVNGGDLIPVSVGDKVYVYAEFTYTSNPVLYAGVWSSQTQTNKSTGVVATLTPNISSGTVFSFTIANAGYFGVAYNAGASTYTVTKFMISKTAFTAEDYVPYAKTNVELTNEVNYGGFAITPATGITIKQNSSRYINAKTVHILVRIQITQNINNAQILSWTNSAPNANMVIPIFCSSTEWGAPDTIKYGYIASTYIAGSVNTTLPYATIDAIIHLD